MVSASERASMTKRRASDRYMSLYISISRENDIGQKVSNGFYRHAGITQSVIEQCISCFRHSDIHSMCNNKPSSKLNDSRTIDSGVRALTDGPN